MDGFNPNALNLWVVGAAIGFAVEGMHGLAVGVAITAGITFLLSLLVK